MTPIKKILVATDLSENADGALDYASKLGAQIGAALHVVHVAQEVPYLGTPLSPGASIAAEYHRQVQHAFDDYLARLHARGLDFKSTLCEGSPARAIVQTAKEAGAELIVMGKHGRGALERMLLGSVAERVARISPIPVLIVPAG